MYLGVECKQRPGSERNRKTEILNSREKTTLVAKRISVLNEVR